MWIGLSRPEAHVDGERLRFPLRLRDASILTLEGTSNLPEYRFGGRYRQQYRVLAGVDFGRPRPTRGMLREADRVLRRLVLPGWLPRPARCRG